MSNVTLTPHALAVSYNLYWSSDFGQSYTLLSNIPQSDNPHYTVNVDAPVLNATLNFNGVIPSLNWLEPDLAGSPWLFKSVPLAPAELWAPSADTLWYQELPTGASWNNQVGVSTLSTSFSPYTTQLETNDGFVFPNFNCVTVSARYLIVWLKIIERPDAFWIACRNGTFEHRGVWGFDKLELIGIPERGEVSRRYLGPLPNDKRWAPLVVDLNLIEAASFDGFGFGLYKESGQAIVQIAAVVLSDQPVLSVDIDAPALDLRPYSVNDVRTDQTIWNDADPKTEYLFEPDLINDQMTIHWYPPTGQTPVYHIKSWLSDNTASSSVDLQSNYPTVVKTEVYISTSPDFLSTPTATVTSGTYTQTGYDGSVFYYQFKHYDASNQLLIIDQLLPSERLNTSTLPFTLDSSPLA